MPPAIALLLCTSYVLILLRVERQASGGVSAVTWIPTIWFLSVCSKPMGSWFGTVGTNEAGSSYDQILLMGLTVAGLVVLVRRRNDWSGALRGQVWLLALLAYMLASTLWSDITLISLRRWVREGIVVIMALVIMSETSPREALGSLLRRSAYLLIPFSLMLINYYPGLGRAYAPWSGEAMWIGVSLHKNGLGRVCVICVFFLLWALYRLWREPNRAGGRFRGGADISVLLIALYLLKGAENAYSATSVGTIVVGLAGFLGLLGLRGLRLEVPRVGLLALVAVLIVFGTSQPFMEGSGVASFSSTLGRDKTLTGRTETWIELVAVVKRQPVLGCGYGSFWTTARREFYRMSHGHNGYLDTLLELGVLGLAFYAAWLLSCARRLHGVLTEDYGWAGLGIGVLLMALVYNVTESALGSLNSEMTAVVVFVSLVSSEASAEPLRAVRRANFRLRAPVPQQQFVGTATGQSGLPENRKPLGPPRRATTT